MRLHLQLPEGAGASPASVFTQTGEFVFASDREDCEGRAEDIGGLYCWTDRGRAVIRHDFAPGPDAETQEP